MRHILLEAIYKKPGPDLWPAQRADGEPVSWWNFSDVLNHDPLAHPCECLRGTEITIRFRYYKHHRSAAFENAARCRAQFLGCGASAVRLKPVLIRKLKRRTRAA